MSESIPSIISEPKTWFRQLFGIREAHLNGSVSHPLQAYRREAIAKLDELDFPTRRHEDWKYTSVSKILQPQYQFGDPLKVSQDVIDPFLFDGLDTYLIVFVDGRWNQDLSRLGNLPEGVAIEKVADAYEKDNFKEVLEEQYKSFANQPENAFVALNTAFSNEAVFIHVPKNTKLEKPVHILHLAANEREEVFNTPQLIGICEQSSELNIIESYHSLSDECVYFTNMVARMVVKDNAKVQHLMIQNESRESFQISNIDVKQHRDSVFSSFLVDLGGKIVRHNLSASLKASNSETHYYGAYYVNGNQHIDSQTFIDHAVPHCESNELYKGIVTDKGRGVFNGKVLVRQDAQKTNAFQQNSTLVLSKNAVMDTKPQLEIFADDVRCSHGATVGQLDESAIFYLRSRGLSEEQAKKILQHAFLLEALEKVPYEPVLAYIEKLILAKFEEQQA